MSNEPDLQTLVEELKSLEKKLEIGYEQSFLISKEDYLRLRELAKQLSSLLPKVSDSTLFEIDDIIYKEDCSEVVAGTKMSSQEKINYLVESCYGPLHQAFFHVRYDFGRDVAMVFFQLLDQMSEHTFKEYSGKYGTLELLTAKLHPHRSLERYMKAFSIALNHRKAIKEQFDMKNFNSHEFHYVIAFLWLLHLPEMSEYESPHEARRALWLSRLSITILQKLPFRYVLLPSQISYLEAFMHQNEGCYNSEYVRFLIICMYKWFIENEHNDMCFNHFYSYFTSARNDDEKIQRIEDFIKGIFMSTFLDASQMDNPEANSRCGIFLMAFSKFIVECVFLFFEKVKRYPSTCMMTLESNYVYDVSSYLPAHDLCSQYIDFKEETVGLMEKYFGKSNNCNDIEPSTQLISEEKKVSYYHKFMKGMRLLDAVHTAWLLLDNVIKFKDLHSGYIAEVFRHSTSPVTKYINKFLEHSSGKGQVHWAIQALLRNCPFLFLSHHQKFHMENLIRMLRGGHNDQASVEMLYFIINSKRYDHALLDSISNHLAYFFPNSEEGHKSENINQNA